MQTSRLFIATAIIEATTGLALLVAPGIVTGLLVGGSGETPDAMVVARVASLAMISISIACWFARAGHGEASRGLVLGLLFYNSSVALLLVHASVGLHLHALGLWPAVAVHAALAVWCAVSLRARSSR